MLKAHGKSVVIVLSYGIDPGDGAEALIRPASLHTQGSARRVRRGLIPIGKDGQTITQVAVIRNFEYGVLRELVLNRRHPRLDVWRSRIGGDVVVVRKDGVEGAGDAGREAGLRGE